MNRRNTLADQVYRLGYLPFASTGSDSIPAHIHFGMLGARLTRVCAFGLFLVSAFVYARTLAPSITWRNAGADSGDLITAAFVSGIPHPPGYPFYTTLLQFSILLPIGSVAYRANLLSAFTAAVAVVLVYAAARIAQSTAGLDERLIAAVSALFFAFTPLFWSQATIAEVYALHTLLFLATLTGFLAWSRAAENPATARSKRLLPIVSSIALGLGLAHHATILLLVPGVLVLAWRKVPPRSLGAAFLAAMLIALLLYLTLPLRALSDPPINWGDPRSFSSWWWVVSGQIYRVYLFGVPFADYPARLSAWAKLLFDQFGGVGVAVGLWGVAELFRRSRRVGIALATTFGLYSIFAISYSSVDSNVYLLPACVVFVLWVAVGLAAIVREISERLELGSRTAALSAVKNAHPSHAQDGWATTLLKSSILTLGLFLLPLWNLASHWSAMDLSRDTAALDYARQVFAAVPDDAMVIADGDQQIFALWYYRYVEQPRSRVTIVGKGLVVFPWYHETLKRHNREWAWPEAEGLAWNQFLEILIRQNLDRHSVFWTDLDPYFQQIFRFDAQGLVYRTSTLAPP